MLIHLIRHTTPKIDSGICYGQTDLDLVDTFEQERDEQAKKLFDQYDALYSSPLKRCSLLADTISASERFIDPRIIEYNFGDWELKPWSELNDQKAKIWMDNFVEQAAPNGESILTMQARVTDFFDELFDTKSERVAIVTHSGVQRLIYAHVLQMPLTHIFRLQLDFGAVIEMKYDQLNNISTLKHL